MRQTLILTAESSCDETAVAIIADGKEISSNVVTTQTDVHKEFGGVTPEATSRIHVENISMIIEEVLYKTNVAMEDIGAIVTTQGPGLVGCLHISAQVAKTLAWTFHKPLVPIHHIAEYIYANWLTTDLKFPLLVLVVSDGHTELVYMKDEWSFEILDTTQDDAIGEAEDKIGRVLGLPYPSGAYVDRIAKEGKPMRKLTRPKTENPIGFPFNGLKSSVLQFIDRCKRKNETFTAADSAVSYQETASDALLERAEYALQKYHPARIVPAGDITADPCLREKVGKGPADKYKDIEFIIPPLPCRIDSVATTAVAGYIAYTHGVRGNFDLAADPGIGLEEVAQNPVQDYWKVLKLQSELFIWYRFF